MTIQPAIRPDHLSRAAATVGAVCALPAVATQDWCEHAAKAMLPIRNDAVICLTIAEFESDGTIRFLEASGAVNGALGATPVETHLLRPLSAKSLGWWLDRATVGTTGQAMLLSQANSPNWPMSPAGRRWAELGFSELIVGLAPIGQIDTNRLIAIEIGVRPGASPLENAEASVVGAVLPELAHRAMLAFGATTSNPLNRITPREQLILGELAYGRTVKQIAEKLGRSPHTVHDHVKSLHRKLNVSSRGELIARVLGHISDAEPTPVADAPANGSTVTIVSPRLARIA